MPTDRRLRRLLALFICVAALLNFPAVSLVDRLARWLGPALVPAYIFGVWLLAVAIAAWLMERRREG